LIKETHWKPEYILWEIPCAWLMLLFDFWPSYTTEDKDKKDVSEISTGKLNELGLKYASNK